MFFYIMRIYFFRWSFKFEKLFATILVLYRYNFIFPPSACDNKNYFLFARHVGPV